MKMIIFDFRESEKEFFKEQILPDFDITFINESLDENTVLSEKELKETDIICVYRSSHLTSEVLSKFHNLRIVATRSYSYAHIDLEYCINHNIAVFNVEQYGEEAVAQYIISLIISLVRNMLPAIVDLKKHRIYYDLYEGRTLNNMTIGIIGCGEVGAMMAKIAHFFGMKVLVYSYMQNPDISAFCKFVSLDELLSESDVISLHVGLNGENYHLLGEEEFEKMKDGVYVINTARGELIDIKALYKNLINGKVKGAGLDVLECEFLLTHPAEFGSVTSSSCVETTLITQKLFNMPNVIITPHIAYNTNESVNFILEVTFNNLRDYFKGMNNNRLC